MAVKQINKAGQTMGLAMFVKHANPYIDPNKREKTPRRQSARRRKLFKTGTLCIPKIGLQ